MKALIVDDEKHARTSLKNLCQLCCPEITSILEASEVEEAIQSIQHQSPDLIFLDINLGTRNGFEVLEALAHLSLNVIFVTAHSEYGIKALRASAIDYLLKPLQSAELIKAVQKVKEKLNQEQEATQLQTLLLNLNQQEKEVERLVVKTSESIHIISVHDIIFCQSDKGYTTFQLVGNKTILSSKILADYEAVLPSSFFMRIHQSYLVNLHHVTRYDKKDKNALITVENHELTVALRRKEQVMKFLNDMAN